MFTQYIEFLRARQFPVYSTSIEIADKITSILSDNAVLSKLFEELISGATPKESPCIIAFAGSPGSGKTTHRMRQYLDRGDFAVRDIDDVIVRLPGYQYDLSISDALTAFNNWWQVALEFAEAIFEFSIINKLNVLYDRTCGTSIALQVLHNAKNIYRYRVDMQCFYVPEEIAKTRVFTRYEKDGARIVSDEIIHEHLTGFVALWPYYLQFVDSVKLYDNSVEELSAETVPGLLCEFSQEMGLNIFNSEGYNTFLAVGKEKAHQVTREITAMNLGMVSREISLVASLRHTLLAPATGGSSAAVVGSAEVKYPNSNP